MAEQPTDVVYPAVELLATYKGATLSPDGSAVLKLELPGGAHTLAALEDLQGPRWLVHVEAMQGQVPMGEPDPAEEQARVDAAAPGPDVDPGTGEVLDGGPAAEPEHAEVW